MYAKSFSLLVMHTNTQMKQIDLHSLCVELSCSSLENVKIIILCSVSQHLYVTIKHFIEQKFKNKEFLKNDLRTTQMNSIRIMLNTFIIQTK